MKKKILIIISLLVVIILVLFALFRFMYLDVKRYNQIKKDVANEAEMFLNLSLSPKYNDGREEYLNEKDITDLNRRGADKSILLDVDEKEYCKTAIYGKCADGKWNVKVYISCKRYKDKEYDDIREKVNHH